MAFRAQEDSGAFEKQHPDYCKVTELCCAQIHWDRPCPDAIFEALHVLILAPANH